MKRHIALTITYTYIIELLLISLFGHHSAMVALLPQDKQAPSPEWVEYQLLFHIKESC